jgi:hypothetical protein
MTLTMAHSSEPLAAYLNERIGHLHQAIRLREGDGATALATFIERYVALVPEFIEVFEDFLASAGISGEIKRQIATAQEFLHVPVDIRTSAEDLEAKMYQAYLAHRLLEELNDVLNAHYNCRVIPVDMTRSNLIVHHIIGEPFANKIDGAIQLLNDKLIASLRKDHALAEKLHTYTNTLSQDPSLRYPCLTESSNIRLLFKGQNSRVRLQ